MSEVADRLERVGAPWAVETFGTSPVKWGAATLVGAVFAAAVWALPGVAGPATTAGWSALLFAAPFIVAADAKLRIIPNRIVFPVTGVVVALFAYDWAFGAMTWQTATAAVAAAVILGVYAFTLWFVAPERGYGWGDVKLTALTAFVLGTHSVWLAFAALAIIAPLLAVIPVLVIAGRAQPGDGPVGVPFGPFIVAAVVLATFAQAPIAAMSPL